MTRHIHSSTLALFEGILGPTRTSLARKKARLIHATLDPELDPTAFRGEGPFPTELFDDVGQHLGTKGHEFGATTGRSRRCGWFDGVALRRAAQINSMTGLCITKLDVLDGLETLKLATSYRYKGEVIDLPPLWG